MNVTGERNVRGAITNSFNELLDKLKLNYTEFADYLGELTGAEVPRNRIRMWAVGINIPDNENLLTLGLLFGLDMNRVFYGEGNYWSPQIQKAQAKMREWAMTMPVDLTPAQRLVAAWGKFSELYPAMPELVWAGYLRWLHFPRAPQVGEQRVVMVYWLQCKFSGASISKLQYDGASDVTGIPAEWFEKGIINENSPQ